ncbi:MAG: hypothetical protein ACERKD_21975 [Prolixibacteraceae bacterium]
MKTKQILTVFLISFLGLAISQCKPESGSGTLKFNATTLKSTQSDASIVLASGNLLVDVAVIQIENIAIEDNTGDENNNELDGENDSIMDNDTIQSENENNDGDKDGDKNEKEDGKDKKEKDDAGDLILAGPFSLDISSGLATIGNISVQPATYKKVNFNFVDGTSSSVNSVQISGTFTDNNGTATPFQLAYNSSDIFQLPLADSGLVVTTGNTVTLSIVFDINSWLSQLDFAAAEVADGNIDISATKNTALYDAFVASLSENIDIED